jgi:hypothetical protein
MRASPLILATALFASPALAGERAAAPPIADPQAIDRIGEMAGALSRAQLQIPNGEVQAAAQGRATTPADRQRTVGDIAGPNADRRLDEGIAHGKVAVEAGMRALAAAMPALEQAAKDVRERIGRAAANMPRPDYPQR